MHLALECFAPVLRPPICESEIAAFSCIVLRTIIDLDPHFSSSANIVLRPPIFDSKIDAFSFRLLRTSSEAADF